MIQIENLTKSYDGLLAVKGLNLQIGRGEFFAFLGPNGAGKTTTIKMLAGLLRPSDGRALIGGHDIQLEPVLAKRLIGYIPDVPYLYEKLTGREFFHFVGDLFHIPRPRQEEQLKFFFDYFNLTEQADTLIENYSHGMRQKLTFSTALMHDPQVIIVDEPMVGLDPRSSRKVKDLLRERCRQGATVFLSTHTLSVAEELAGRIGIINHGELIFLGGIAELRARVQRDGNLEELFLKLTEEDE
ncbi:MAG: ABC transporter ATP-binding protein [Candidatus Sumerlaeia bacterium]